MPVNDVAIAAAVRDRGGPDDPRTIRFRAQQSKPLSLVMLGLLTVLPFSRLIVVEFVGTLTMQDVLALALLPVLLMDRHAARLSDIKAILAFLALWLAGQVITDVLREIPLADMAKGAARIVTFGVQIAVLWKLTGRSYKLIVFYMAMFGLSLMLGSLLPSADPRSAGWKFDFGMGVAILGAAAISTDWVGKRLFSTVYQGVAFALLAILFLYENARSNFGILAAAGGYIVLAGIVARNRRLAAAIRPRHFVVLMISGLIAMQALTAVYGYAAESGFLGEEGRKKYEVQTAGDLGVLLGGRVESLVSLVAIGDSPIIGHGSWANGIEYVRLLNVKLQQRGIRGGGSVENSMGLIPSHSFILGAWVDAGIVGGLFWTYVLLIGLRALYYLLKLGGMPSPLVAFSVFSLLWMTLFSPFGTNNRFAAAGELTVLASILSLTRAAQARERQSAALRLARRRNPESRRTTAPVQPR